MDTNKNVRMVANMFGSKPYTSMTNPSDPKHSENTSHTFQHLINGEKLDDIDKEILKEKHLDTSELVKDIKKPVQTPSAITKMQRFITRKILSKVSKRLNSITELSNSLDALNSINKNIDELIIAKPLHADATQNYEKLASYLGQANKIQSHIIKSMNAIK